MLPTTVGCHLQEQGWVKVYQAENKNYSLKELEQLEMLFLSVGQLHLGTTAKASVV